MLDCGAPAYLPFRLLRRVQAALRDGAPPLPFAPSHVLYDEADQTLHFDQNVAADAYAAIEQIPDAIVVPQRYQKRWAAPPASIERTGLARTMNKCGRGVGPPVHAGAVT